MSDDPRGLGQGEWLRQWEQSVAKWWDAALEDPAFTRSMGDALSGRAQLQSAQAQAAERLLEQMHLPSKADLVRLARIVSLLEDRMVHLEDQLAETTSRLDRMEKETLRARIDAAEALVRLEEQLRSMNDKLDALAGKAEPEPAPRARRRG